MKPFGNLKLVTALLLINLISTGPAQAATNSATVDDEAKTFNASKDRAMPPPGKYPGYSVDGRTSASVLTAKRSHTVSKEDETGLAVYSGLLVIGLIVFFVQALSKKK